MKHDPELFDLTGRDLHYEWDKQSGYCLDYGEALADAEKAYEDAERDLELIGAELDQKIRRNPQTFGLEKLTEEVVKKTIILQEEYQDVKTRTITTRHAVQIHKARVAAMNHRKTALENKVSMELGGMHSEPLAKRGDREEMERRESREVFGRNKRKGG